ncbi:hypothetical protein Gorai_023288, partial [Gossypium raimondii]|nr:hypothetical protein [Gossypium raimondii]
MALGVEIAVIGWDLSLRAQSRISLALSNIWLREGGEGEKGEILIKVELYKAGCGMWEINRGIHG